jgi:hypothetical protein
MVTLAQSVMVDTAAFDKDVATIIKSLQKVSEELPKYVAKVTYSMVAQELPDKRHGGIGSPVKTGNFANNHRIAVGSIDATYSRKATESQPIPAPTVIGQLGSSSGYVDGALASYTLGQPIFISNSTPYARKVEDFGWTNISAYIVYHTASRYVEFFIDESDIQRLVIDKWVK